jgi:hypothetical protein
LAPGARYIVFHRLDELEEGCSITKARLFDAFTADHSRLWHERGGIAGPTCAPLRLRVERQIGYKNQIRHPNEAVDRLTNRSGNGGFGKNQMPW